MSQRMGQVPHWHGRGRTLGLLLVPAALGLPGIAAAGEPEGSVEGFVEVRAQVQAGVEGNPLLMVERFRPTFAANLSDRVALSSTLELNLSQGRRTQTELQSLIEDSALGPALDAAQCTWPTEDNETLWVSELGDYLYVDRLYVDVYLPRTDIRAGRQALQWGSALMVNPSDPFPQVLLLTPWLPRAGVNSVRASVPLGEAHQLQAVVGADDDFRALRAAGRGTLNLFETDFSVVGAYRQGLTEAAADTAIAGLDIKGTLGVGFWLEGVVHLDLSEGPADPYSEVAVGLDYSFPVLEMLIVQAQYYRNGAGSAAFDASSSTGGLADAVAMPTCTGVDLADALGAGADTAEPDPFAPRFTGRDYLMSALSLGLTRDLSLSGAWVQNLGDGSGMVVPTVTVLPTGWLELGAAAQLPMSLTGESGELRPSDEDLVLSDPNGATLLDLSGLVPTATFLVWTRASF